jgi:hypothetical protein
MKLISKELILSKICNKFFLSTIILLFLAKSVFPADKTSIDMGRVFSSGLISSLYGAAVIGGGNTIVILMSDNTKSNLYRIKYGFAIGTILGLVYGTIVGIQGLPLVPSFDTKDSNLKTFSPSRSDFMKLTIFNALTNLNIDISEKSLYVSTTFIKIPFSNFL